MPVFDLVIRQSLVTRCDPGQLLGACLLSAVTRHDLSWTTIIDTTAVVWIERVPAVPTIS